MIIKLARRLYLKPRKCPDCKKRLYFAEHPASIHCRACSKSHDRAYEHYLAFWIHKTIARKFGHCALCGTKSNLTIHHVGGRYRHYTTLCSLCHSQYEDCTNRNVNIFLPLFRSLLWIIN